MTASRMLKVSCLVLFACWFVRGDSKNNVCNKLNGTLCKPPKNVLHPLSDFFFHACKHHHICLLCGYMSAFTCDGYFYATMRMRCGWWSTQCTDDARHYYAAVLRTRRTESNYFKKLSTIFCIENDVSKCLFCRNDTC